MNAKAARGEIPKRVVEEFNEASKGMKLPEKAKPKPPTKNPRRS